MASAAEQEALVKSPYINPDHETADLEDEAYAPSKANSQRGFLKVCCLGCIDSLNDCQTALAACRVTGSHT